MTSYHQMSPTQAAWQGEWPWEEHRGTELYGKLAGDPSSLRSPKTHQLVLTGEMTWPRRYISLSCRRRVPILPLTPCVQTGYKLVCLFMCINSPEEKLRENCVCLRNGYMSYFIL